MAKRHNITTLKSINKRKINSCRNLECQQRNSHIKYLHCVVLKCLLPFYHEINVIKKWKQINQRTINIIAWNFYRIFFEQRRKITEVFENLRRLDFQLKNKVWREVCNVATGDTHFPTLGALSKWTVWHCLETELPDAERYALFNSVWITRWVDCLLNGSSTSERSSKIVETVWLT